MEDVVVDVAAGAALAWLAGWLDGSGSLRGPPWTRFPVPGTLLFSTGFVHCFFIIIILCN